MNAWDVIGAQAYLHISEDGGIQSNVRKIVCKDFDFSPIDEVLDVGCWPGTACGEIAPRVKSVTGIDQSPGMISVANQKYAASNVDFVVADAHSFGQGWEEKLDKIICLCVLHWCGDQKRVLQNVFRCLKPGGHFLLRFNLQSQLLSKRCKYGETGDTWLRAHPKWGPYLTDYEYEQTDWPCADDFLNMFQSVGFKAVSSQAADVTWVKWNAIEIKDHIRIAFGHLRRIPDDLQDECIDDIHRWLVDVTPKTSEGLPIGPIGRMEALHVVATK
ncbi:juvenile hormone acid O-methyltransferase-like [Diadema setosum]|uniref:juvenile hormone acid O-methyltransferase-like n=1 Tax=Diadema setosum TaxID=31175 RepID=UPI003B3ABAD7